MNWMYSHKDIIEVILVGAGGLTASLTVADHALRILLTLASLGFVLYKWHKETKK